MWVRSRRTISATRGVGVATPPIGETVVMSVIDAAEAQRRPQVAAFGGVVVDDVEDDLQAGGMQCPHHALEL